MSSVKITGAYLGEKKLRLVHESGVELVTAAPRDNHGDGSSFSPTDMVASALGACMLTVMSIFAERNGIDLSGATLSVEKFMNSEPRRIGLLKVEIHLPEHISPENRLKLERTAKTCPVKNSLHPDVAIDLAIRFDVRTPVETESVP